MSNEKKLVNLTPMQQSIIGERLRSETELPEIINDVMCNIGATHNDVGEACFRIHEAIGGPLDLESMLVIDRAVLNQCVETSAIKIKAHEGVQNGDLTQALADSLNNAQAELEEILGL
jgi:hypothetical protein